MTHPPPNSARAIAVPDHLVSPTDQMQPQQRFQTFQIALPDPASRTPVPAWGRPTWGSTYRPAERARCPVLLDSLSTAPRAPRAQAAEPPSPLSLAYNYRHAFLSRCPSRSSGPPQKSPSAPPPRLQTLSPVPSLPAAKRQRKTCEATQDHRNITACRAHTSVVRVELLGAAT